MRFAKFMHVEKWDRTTIVQIISSTISMECIARIPTIPLKFDTIVDHDLYVYLQLESNIKNFTVYIIIYALYSMEVNECHYHMQHSF